jgi:hypothetical protein
LFAANSVVQQFLSMIAIGIHHFSTFAQEEKLLIPMPLLTKVLGQLVNPNVTELNCMLFDNSIFEIDNSCFNKDNDFLAEHALKNCPKISKIGFNHLKPLMVGGKPQELPVELLKKSWINLRTIKTTNFICKENTLKLIQQNFPNLG